MLGTSGCSLQQLDEEATHKLARKDEAEKKEKAQREYDHSRTQRPLDPSVDFT